jgi:hypothetical protein
MPRVELPRAESVPNVQVRRKCRVDRAGEGPAGGGSRVVLALLVAWAASTPSRSLEANLWALDIGPRHDRSRLVQKPSLVD